MMQNRADAQALERLILETIPLARAMGLQVLEYDGHRLALSAPLATNINDKGCAFGGSIASLLTLAGWGLATLRLAHEGIQADIFIQDVQLDFLTPIWSELVAEAYVDPEPWSEFVAQLATKGKARLSVRAEMTAMDGGGVAAKQTALFVAKRKT